MNMITLSNIKKDFGKNEFITHALRGVTLEIKEGEMVAITGTSGSGKTTLLNIIGCLDYPSEGKYFLNGDNILSKSKKEMAKLRNEVFGFVIQDFALVEHYTVKQNVSLPLLYTKNNKIKSKRKSNIKNLLVNLGIEDKEDVKTGLLSGGQKQRVAIARALVNEPNIILADEPTGALDQKNSLEIMQLLKNLNKEGKTVIIITHDPAVASHCSRVVEMLDGLVHGEVVNESEPILFKEVIRHSSKR